MLDAEELIRSLRALRQYCRTLEGSAQLPLDSMVMGALTYTPAQRLPDAAHTLWSAYGGNSHINRDGLGDTDGAAGWATSPWGRVYGEGADRSASSTSRRRRRGGDTLLCGAPYTTSAPAGPVLLRDSCYSARHISATLGRA